MHVAIIMDGNGRWAQDQGRSRTHGHRAGVKAFREVVRAADDQGITHLTCFGFSTENWQRPKNELNIFFGLVEHYITHHIHELHDQGVSLRLIGQIDRFPPAITEQLHRAVAKTANNQGLVLTIALSYGGRAEIVAAARKLCGQNPENITEERFASALETHDLPEPDLLIRTSGEKRLSNFLLWQMAYTEFVFVDKHWPDFGADDLAIALKTFQQRKRRFGGL